MHDDEFVRKVAKKVWERRSSGCGLKVVLLVGITSRVICIFMAIVSTFIMNTYHTSTNLLPLSQPELRTRYERCNTVLMGCTVGDPLFTYHPYTRFIVPFLRWDAEYFVHLSMNPEAYEDTEKLAAFFPLLPNVMRFLAKLIPSRKSASSFRLSARTPWRSNWLDRFIAYDEVASFRSDLADKVWEMMRNSIAGIVLTNLCFIGAILILYRMAFLVFAWVFATAGLERYNDSIIDSYAILSCICFAFGAANIHFSALQTESIFSCLSFASSYFLLYTDLSFRANGAESYFLITASVALSTCAAAIRSNGILALIPLFLFTLQHSDILNIRKLFTPQDGTKGSQILEFVRNQTFYWGMASMAACCIASPTVYVLWSGYKNHCYQASSMYIKSEDFHAAPFNCNKENIPNIYSHVQREYWDVYFLSYWLKPEKLYRILLAAPCFYLTFHLLVTQLKHINRKGVLCFLSNPVAGIMLNLFSMAGLFLFFANAEVYIRMAYAVPIFPMYLAYFLLNPRYAPLIHRNTVLTPLLSEFAVTPNGEDVTTTKILPPKDSTDKFGLFSQLIRIAVVAQLILCFFVGPPLYSNFITWT